MMANPLTTRPKKLSVKIQCVMRTSAEWRGESRTSEVWSVAPRMYAASAIVGADRLA